MIRDRGRIKWTAMMLPEHVSQLREWQAEDAFSKREYPDEQQLEEWNYKIDTALERNGIVSIEYWLGQEVRTATGFIQKIDALQGMLYIGMASGEAQRVPFVDIKSISEIE